MFLYTALVRVNAYKCAKFQLPSSIDFWDKEKVPTFNVGATSPLPYRVRWKFCVCSNYWARSNSQPNFSIVPLCIMQLGLYEYVFPIGLLLYVPKNGVFGSWGWRCENIVFWPPKGTTLREYASVDVSRDKIGSTAWALGRWKDFCVQRKKEKN